MLVRYVPIPYYKPVTGLLVVYGNAREKHEKKLSPSSWGWPNWKKRVVTDPPDTTNTWTLDNGLLLSQHRCTDCEPTVIDYLPHFELSKSWTRQSFVLYSVALYTLLKVKTSLLDLDKARHAEAREELEANVGPSRTQKIIRMWRQQSNSLQ